MRGKPLRYVICYDIPDDRRRIKVARCLDGYGDRVQFSVFEALIDNTLMERLAGELGELIDEAEDSVRIYPMCSSCAAKVRKLGVMQPGPEVGEEIVFIVWSRFLRNQSGQQKMPVVTEIKFFNDLREVIVTEEYSPGIFIRDSGRLAPVTENVTARSWEETCLRPRYITAWPDKEGIATQVIRIYCSFHICISLHDPIKRGLRLLKQSDILPGRHLHITAWPDKEGIATPMFRPTARGPARYISLHDPIKRGLRLNYEDIAHDAIADDITAWPDKEGIATRTPVSVSSSKVFDITAWPDKEGIATLFIKHAHSP